MRLYELAKEHGVDDKKGLLAALHEAGFEIKNTLSSVDDAIIEWVSKEAKAGFPALGGAEAKPAKTKKKVKKKAGKKKAAAAPAPAEEAAPAEEEAKEAAPAEEAKRKTKVKKKIKKKVKRRIANSETGIDVEAEAEAKRKAKEEEARAKAEEEAARKAAEAAEAGEPEEEEAPEEPVEEEVAPEEEAAPEEPVEEAPEPEEPKTFVYVDLERGGVVEQAPAKPQQPVKQARVSKKKKKEKKVKRVSGPKAKARGGTELKLSRLDEPIDTTGSDVEIEQEEDATRTTGAGHKRADFRQQRQVAELPAMFQETDYNLTRSLTGGGKRPRRRSRRPTHRRGRSRGTASIPRERDPNAVSMVQVGMTVRELSEAIGIKMNDIVAFFMKNGQLINVNEALSEDDITLVAEQFEVKYDWRVEQTLEEKLQEEFVRQEEDSNEEDMVDRPPVITFLGHVDHGKTSLLDKIRETRVAAHEAGGITQHIGAYTIEKNDQQVTFLDTPGHEAFTAMRARGANLTDIAVLIVAADDGVMPQTEEACSHARNAGVPIVVAINKCDLPGANPDKVRQELSTRLELLPEEWGGNVGMIEVSAQTGEGIDQLLERILLESEMLELKADPNKMATGNVLEANVSESRGVVATVLIADGTLCRGDVILCSAGYGKVKLMYDEHGDTIEEAGPGHAVRIVGLSNVPETGDQVYVLEDILKARAIAEQRERDARSQALSKRAHVTLDNLMGHLADEEVKELRIVIKADVKGSLEVLEKTLTDLSTDEVKINVIHSAVGGVNQADVILADASDAIIVGFHVVADSSARLQASSLGVQIKVYHIIYRLIEDMKAALEGMLPPEEKEVVQGHLDVRQVFKASRIGSIAGCYVTDGLITRASKVRLIRDNVVIYDGTIQTLRRFKDDAKEVREGYECGLKIANYDDIKEGDSVEAYTIEEVARKLE